jgi:putative endonuclease
MSSLQAYAKKIVGNQGELAVVHYLERAGYAIYKRNYTVRAGEIDIIAAKDKVVAFVEVKTRTTPYFNLSEVIVGAKQRKIIRAARNYIFMNRLEEVVLRFDVALVHPQQNIASENAAWNITYIPNAFTDTESLL